MLKVPVYNVSGEQVREVELNPAIFAVEINPAVVHQVVLAQRANNRVVLGSTKDKSEVSGGGKKPWKQKGTGRARHGSSRSPIWRGGGITFGPTTERNFAVKVNKKVKRKALLMSLSDKITHSNFIVVESVSAPELKIKNIVELLQNLKLRPKKVAVKKAKEKTDDTAEKPKKKKDQSVLIITPGSSQEVFRASRNISKVDAISAKSLNTVDVLAKKYLVVSVDALPVIEETFAL